MDEKKIGDTFCEIRTCNKADHPEGEFAVVPFAASRYANNTGGCVSFSPHYNTIQEAIDHKNQQNDRARRKLGK